MSRYIKSLASQDMLFEYRTCFGFCSAAIHIISYSSDAAAYSCNGGTTANPLRLTFHFLLPLLAQPALCSLFRPNVDHS